MVTATFPDVDSARQAALHLEHSGLDGSLVSMRPVLGDVPASAAGGADRRLFERVAGRAVAGAVVVAVALAIVLLLVIDAVDPSSRAMWTVVAMVAALFVGASVGAFLNVLWGLPMGHDLAEAMTVEATGPVEVTVASDDPAVEETARRVLDDGRATDVT